MRYLDLEHALEYQRNFPALDVDLEAHEFQRMRVKACTKFVLPGDVVLDVGCNTGYYANALPDNEVHGVDLAPALIAVARQRMASVHLAPAERLPFLNGSFHVVNLGGILQQTFDPKLAVLEAARVSSRCVTGTTPCAEGAWGKHRIEKHIWQSWSFTRDEILEVLTVAGRVTELGTVDAGNPPVPQCWYWCVEV